MRSHVHLSSLIETNGTVRSWLNMVFTMRGTPRAMACRPLRTIAIVALSWATIGSKMEGVEMTEREQLFKNALSAQGPEYVRLRKRLLLEKMDATAFLQEKAVNAVGDDASWFAEILLARLTNFDEFGRLERVFADKVRLVKFGQPSTRVKPMPHLFAFLHGLSLWDEAIPQVTASGEAQRPKMIEFYRRTRIPESDYWKPFLGEVLLKGWQPSTVPPAPEPDYGPPEDRDEYGMPYSFEHERTLNTDDFLRQAIILLGKLGEKRAAPRMAAILDDGTLHTITRELAAKALAALNVEAGFPTLLKLAEDDGALSGVRIAVIRALGEMKDARAVPVLERIAANPDNTLLRGNVGPKRYKEEARVALRKIRGE
jgi:hypothetical protein